jgi:WD40 repeat protein
MDSTVKIWDVKSGTEKITLDGPGDEIRFVDWHPKGNVIAAGLFDILNY